MTQKLNPFSGRQFLDLNGDPYVGAQLFTYVAGSSTKTTTTKDSAGSSNHANPIILNARGEPGDGSGASQAIWQPEGVSVKLVLAPSTDTDPPVAPISTWDNLDGVNDITLGAQDQWIAGPAPTFVSATSFTLVGDQSTDFHIGRRLKTINSGGTIYSTITDVAYTSLTTVTVYNDTGALDSGLSAASYGMLTATNDAIPGGTNQAGAEDNDVASATTTDIWGMGGLTKHVTGTTTITSFGTAKKAGDYRWVIFDGILTLTHGANLVLPGSANITTAAGDLARVYADTTTQLDVQYFRADGKPAIGYPAADGSSLALIEKQTASNSASIDFTTGIDSAYDEYEIHVTGFVPTTDAQSLYVRISTDGGSSWEAGTGYRYVQRRHVDNGTSAYTASTGASLFSLITDVGTNGGEGADGIIRFYNPSSATAYKRFSADLVGSLSSAAVARYVFAGVYNFATVINGVQIYASASTVEAGTFALYGVKK